MAHILYSASHLFNGQKIAIKAVIALGQWYQNGDKGKKNTYDFILQPPPLTAIAVTFVFYHFTFRGKALVCPHLSGRRACMSSMTSIYCSEVFIFLILFLVKYSESSL